MNSAYLLEELRANVGETDAEKHWTDAELLRKLSFSHKKAGFMVSASDGDRLQKSTDLIPSSSIVTLPSDFSKFNYMEEKVSGREIPLVNTVRERRVNRSYATGLDLGTLSCYFSGDTIEINHDDYSTVVTLWYEPKIINLHAGIGFTGSTTNTIVFEVANDPSFVDDYYNDTSFTIIAGTGLGTTVAVSDYVGATYTATLAGTFSTSSVYGSISPLPEECAEFIVLDATVSAMAKPSAALDPKYFEYFRSRLADARRLLDGWLAVRSRLNKHIRYSGS